MLSIECARPAAAPAARQAPLLSRALLNCFGTFLPKARNGKGLAAKSRRAPAARLHGDRRVATRGEFAQGGAGRPRG